MPNKTIFALDANVALDKANDIFHLWQPAASGEKDRKATLQTLIDLLDVNTSFSNVPYLDKANTFTAQNIFTGIVTVGEVNPGATHPLEVFSSTVDIAARIETSLANGIAGLIMENDVQSWEPRVDTDDNYVLRDITNSLSPIQVEPGAPTSSDYTDATGKKGWGRAPTTAFDMYRATEDNVAFIETGKVNGLSSLALINDAQDWNIQTATNDLFKLVDSTNTKTPISVEPNSPTNSLYIATTGISIGQATAFFPLDIFTPGSSNTIDGNSNYEAVLGVRGTDGHGLSMGGNTTDGVAFIGSSANGDDFILTTRTSSLNFERLRITALGSILKGTPTSLHSTIPTIESFGTWALIGRDADGDDVNKITHIGLTHFDIDEEPFVLIRGFSGTSSSAITIGGGLSSGNAATQISFYIAADTTTLTGTEAGRIATSRNWLINTTSDVTDARFQIGGTDGALLLSRLTTGERDALTATNGMVLYNSTTNRLEAYENGSWVDL